MVSPKYEAKKSTKDQRGGKEPARLWKSYQSKKQHSDHNDQTNRMAGQKTSAVAPKRQNLSQVWFGVVWGSLSPVANLEGCGNHRFSLGLCARCSKMVCDPSSLAHAPRMGARSTGGTSFVPPSPVFLKRCDSIVVSCGGSANDMIPRNLARQPCALDPHPVFFVSVASTEFRLAISVLFATLARWSISVAFKGVTFRFSGHAGPGFSS
jgi:hypothetical protein